MTPVVLFAAAEGFERQVKEAVQGGRFDTRDALMAISISVAAGLILFIWAFFRYRKKEDVKQPRVVSKQETIKTIETVSESGEPERRRHRKRRRRRDHRPRNPSLQQTGGLPPTRPDDELPKH